MFKTYTMNSGVIFLQLFTELFHKEFASLVRTNTIERSHKDQTVAQYVRI